MSDDEKGEHLHTAECAICGATDQPMELRAKCHPGSGLRVLMYETKLMVKCKECERDVVQFGASGTRPEVGN